MNKEQFQKLTDIEEIKKVIAVDDLTNKTGRTLLYGYTCERETWHVYLKYGEIVKVIYGYDKEPKKFEVTDNRDFVPDKRLYPERCDYEFCKLLIEKGIGLPFTAWTEGIEEEQYYGKILE
ncbi:hypothetical protein [Paenibacillus elgii]|uniref:hypothetical protein n=1 Tax=Paenibacillus elgii TaxID=189691 RepID=UPI000248C6D6|nr:hypothetical protein [Paenibacillus elgii]